MTVSPLFRTWIGLMVFLTVLGACTDDSDSAAISVANLSSSECDKEAARSARDSNDERCVISRREGKKLALQVFGMRTSCLDGDLLKELPWRGAAREEGEGRVVVSVEWPSDKTPGCGECVYNFKVELGPYDWPERTDVKFEVRSCPSCDADSRSVTVGTAPDERSVVSCGDEQLDAGSS